jgi:hypothetical protein
MLDSLSVEAVFVDGSKVVQIPRPIADAPAHGAGQAQADGQRAQGGR